MAAFARAEQVFSESTSENQLHPVSEEMVQEIRAKTDKWSPMEVADNKFSKYSI